MAKKGFIYGDSLLKATVPEADGKYKFHLGEVMGRYGDAAEHITNRAKFGATVEKGMALVSHDLERGMDADWALIGYGGNDSDYAWADIAADPKAVHLPRTSLARFGEVLGQTVALLRERGVQPVLMTLPPIDAQRYFDFFCRSGLDRNAILSWLGEIGVIYRHQEMYSDAIATFARRQDVPLIDVRRCFLPDHHLGDLIASDGIHLTLPGYERMMDAIFAAVGNI